MRKNETPADPEICHICLSLKNHLFPKAGAVRHYVHTKYSEMWKNDKSFTQSLIWRESEGFTAPPHLLRNDWPPSHQPLTGNIAIPSTVRLMVLWSQAANFSLSRNNPLHWQMRVIWRDGPLIQTVYTWMAPASKGPLGEIVRDFDQFLLSKHEIRTMLSRGHGLVICLLNAVGLHTNRMRIC